MTAIWDLDYDLHTDSCYQCPSCPECQAPIGKDGDGLYRCFSCGEIVDVTDPEMLEWFRLREETKIERTDCKQWKTKAGKTIGCGGENCYVTHYVRNLVTLEWPAAYGGCEKCGTRFIV